MASEEKIQELITKIKKLESGDKLDLSSGEDLSIGVMNLISIEEHLFFSSQKTEKKVYLDLLHQVREMRKSLLKKIIKDYEGEVWCISKHLLAASMRLMEVGTKFLNKGDKSEAWELFRKSYRLYNLFWGLNLGLVKTEDVKQEDSQEVKFVGEGEKPEIKATAGAFEKLGQILKKVLDCCRE